MEATLIHVKALSASTRTISAPSPFLNTGRVQLAATHTAAGRPGDELVSAPLTADLVVSLVRPAEAKK